MLTTTITATTTQQQQQEQEQEQLQQLNITLSATDVIDIEKNAQTNVSAFKYPDTG